MVSKCPWLCVYAIPFSLVSLFNGISTFVGYLMSQSLFIYIYIYIVSWPTVVEGDPKAPFSIATIPKCKGGRNSFHWIPPLTLDQYLIMLNVKQRSIAYHFLSLWTPLSLFTRKHSKHYFKGPVVPIKSLGPHRFFPLNFKNLLVLCIQRNKCKFSDVCNYAIIQIKIHTK